MHQQSSRFYAWVTFLSQLINHVFCSNQIWCLCDISTISTILRCFCEISNNFVMSIGFDRDIQTKNSRIFEFGLNSINTRRNIAISVLDLFHEISIELTFSTWIDWKFFGACNLRDNMYNKQCAMHTMHYRILCMLFSYYKLHLNTISFISNAVYFFFGMELLPLALTSSISIKMSINFFVMHKFQAKYVRK